MSRILSNHLASHGIASGVFSRLSHSQLKMDSMFATFSREATNVISLTAMMAGGLAYRLGKVASLSLIPKVFSPLVGLAFEVTAFEGTSQFLGSFSSHSLPFDSFQGRPLTPHNFSESWRNSFVDFGIMKSVGHLLGTSNILLRHLSQDFSMVAAHQGTALLGFTSCPEGSFIDQMLHAEIVNLQLGVGSHLGALATGHRLQTLEHQLQNHASIFSAMGLETLNSETVTISKMESLLKFQAESNTPLDWREGMDFNAMEDLLSNAIISISNLQRINDFLRDRNTLTDLNKSESNEVFIIQIQEGMRAVWKPDQGRIKRGLSERDAYRFSRLMGVNLVPPTVYRKIGEEWGSLQLYIEGAKTVSTLDITRHPAWKELPEKIRSDSMIFYFVSGQWDRKAAHQLIVGNSLALCDNDKVGFLQYARWGEMPFRRRYKPIGPPTENLPEIDSETFPFDQAKYLENISAEAYKDFYRGSVSEKELERDSKYPAQSPGFVLWSVRWRGYIWNAFRAGSEGYGPAWTDVFYQDTLEKLAALDFVTLRTELSEVFTDEHIRSLLDRRDQVLRQSAMPDTRVYSVMSMVYPKRSRALPKGLNGIHVQLENLGRESTPGSANAARVVDVFNTFYDLMNESTPGIETIAKASVRQRVFQLFHRLARYDGVDNQVWVGNLTYAMLSTFVHLPHFQGEEACRDAVNFVLERWSHPRFRLKILKDFQSMAAFERAGLSTFLEEQIRIQESEFLGSER